MSYSKVVINLLNRFVMFDVGACLWSALWGILETGLSSGFLEEEEEEEERTLELLYSKKPRHQYSKV